jgi:long-chain fatty acid transport protein
MNMEGYGAVAAAMGGASMAYDNGTAAFMNNPATLALMPEGKRLDVAFGYLGPQVKSQGVASEATAFSMPAFGWVVKSGRWVTGVGVYGQGGMGTEYADSSQYGTLAPFGSATGVGSNRRNRSEVGVGRVIFPVAVEVNDKLSLGGSVDYVWAGMDVQWLVDGKHFADLMATSANPAATHTFGVASGSMVDAFGTQMGLGNITGLGWGYFDFSNDNRYTGQAVGTGYAGKLGLTYKVSSRLTMGATYHSKTRISDLVADQAAVTFQVDGAGAFAGQPLIPVKGKMVVKDFQWPETFGFGLSYQADDHWQWVADYKRIGWKDAMRSFRMQFTAAGAAEQSGLAVGFANTVMDLDYKQQWKDQHVLMVGAAYSPGNGWTWRAGLNLANNPVPDQYVTPLFPAITTSHLTLGAGYAFSKASTLDLAVSIVPKVTVTNRWGSIGGQNQTISMSQTNMQLLYGYRY